MTQQTDTPNPNDAEVLGHAGPSGSDVVPCSLSYDPKPYKEAKPTPRAWYERSGIGFLYGLPGCEHYAWQLAGWNIEGLIEFEEVPLEDE